MQIVDIKEGTLSTGEKRSNAVMDFSDMTTGFVAVITDVIRDGRPVVGYGFSGTGRYSQNAICRERLIPRLLVSPPEQLATQAAMQTDHSIDLWHASRQANFGTIVPCYPKLYRRAETAVPLTSSEASFNAPNARGEFIAAVEPTQCLSF